MPTNKGNILIIEDNPQISQNLCQIFQSKYYNTTSTSSAKHASKLLLTESPIAVICDYDLEDGNAQNILASLPEDKKNLPFIIFSATSEANMQALQIFKNVKATLCKPIEPVQIISLAEKFTKSIVPSKIFPRLISAQEKKMLLEPII